VTPAEGRCLKDETDERSWDMRSTIAVCAAALALGPAGAALAHGGGGDDPAGHEARHHHGVGRHVEVRGRIVAFANGVLTLRERDGDRVRGRVTAATGIECGDRTAARPASQREDEPGDDRGEDCGTDALTTGRVVREAKLRTTGGRATFVRIELR
jgi:hypothetical protein